MLTLVCGLKIRQLDQEMLRFAYPNVDFAPDWIDFGEKFASVSDLGAIYIDTTGLNQLPQRIYKIMPVNTRKFNPR